MRLDPCQKLLSSLLNAASAVLPEFGLGLHFFGVGNPGRRSGVSRRTFHRDRSHVRRTGLKVGFRKVCAQYLSGVVKPPPPPVEAF